MRRLVLLTVLAAALGAVGVPAAAADVTWCGSGESAANRLPDALAGQQVRVVYAYPSDGADGFSAAASQIASDVDRVDAWWRTQDATRTPRFDLYPFPNCTGAGSLDLGSVKLPLTAADLTPNDTRYERIARAVPSFEPGVKLLVFYDGPLADPALCGTASGDPQSGSGSLAVLFLRSSCMGSTGTQAAVLAHELTHELGAPTPFSPHACPGDLGHVCDSSHDLMYPYLSVDSIDQLVLDAGHDDYYRVGDRLFDLSTSLWLRHLDAAQEPLAVTVSGGGTVTSDVPGVACADSCTSRWDAGSTVMLEAAAGPGMRFVGWKGGCSGDVCSLTLTAPVAVAAVFAPARVQLAVRLQGRGDVAGGGISCPGRCAAAVAAGRALTLRATPARGWAFARWTGICSGPRPTCKATPQAAGSVLARFRRLS